MTHQNPPENFGDRLTLTFGYDLPIAQQITVALSRSANEFKVGLPGEGYLQRIGYDRVVRPETEPEIEDHILGDMLIKQVAYGLKYQCSSRLQLLTVNKANAITDMVTAQQKTKKLIKLDDEILYFREYGARSRYLHAPFVGTQAPNLSTYYTSFLVWLKIDRIEGYSSRFWELDFTATERGKPLPP
jgi:hypothetical protein